MWGGRGINEGHSVAVNALGEVYLTGISSGAITLNTISHSAPADNIYTVLTKISGSATEAGAGKNEIKLLLNIYPNSAQHEVSCCRK